MHNKCPRCKSNRKERRLNDDKYCLNCGQRWTLGGELIPSFDRRGINISRQVKEKELVSFNIAKWFRENIDKQDTELIRMLNKIRNNGIKLRTTRKFEDLIKDYRYTYRKGIKNENVK